MSIPDILFIVVTAVLLIPFAVFWVQCWLALLPRKPKRVLAETLSGEVWVVVPAHNESSVIAATVVGTLETLAPNEQLLIVADNCTDNTAAIAKDLGANVIERQNYQFRGKGYALQYAFEYLKNNHQPTVIVVLDADCQVSPNLVHDLSQLAYELQRPVQSLNLSHADANAQSLHVLSELGFRFKNLVRPLGLHRLGLPCHLMGTGMAIPWELLQQCDISGSALAEDMHLGVDLAKRGYPTEFYPDSLVSSSLPQHANSFMTQRTRWEQGHLRTSLTQIPVLFWAALKTFDLRLLTLALDLTVLPFSLLMMLLALNTALSLVAFGLGLSLIPFVICLAAGLLTALTIGCGWWRFCRKQIPFSAMLGLPLYMLKKLPIYCSFLLGRGVTHWVRTERQPKPM